jgi:hypothetical protein
LEQAGELEEELKRKKKYWTPNPYGLCWKYFCKWNLLTN